MVLNASAFPAGHRSWAASTHVIIDNVFNGVLQVCGTLACAVAKGQEDQSMDQRSARSRARMRPSIKDWETILTNIRVNSYGRQHKVSKLSARTSLGSLTLVDVCTTMWLARLEASNVDSLSVGFFRQINVTIMIKCGGGRSVFNGTHIEQPMHYRCLWAH